MLQPIYIIPILFITVFFLVRAEFGKIKQQIFIFKPLSSILLIIALILSYFSTSNNINYSFGILLGLLFTLSGDIALMFPENKKAFNIGLRLFLFAHVIYGTLFMMYGEFSINSILPVIAFLIIGILIFTYLKPNLGKMKIPVLLYIIIISVMVISSFSLMNTFHGSQAIMVICGAISFYISDLIMALSRFGKSWKYNRISLVFYYTGQILIALSAGYF